MAETFHGYIDTTQDVLLIFEGCRRGLLPRVNRRLQEKERKLIQSGSVFVFDERESGVKRWTDGLVWSPSRILGNFLIYRELEKRNGEKRMSISDHRQRSYSMDVSSTVAAAGRGYLPDRVKEKRLVGSLSEVYNFRPDGLIKKTMSIVVNGSTQHLISYYHPQDIIENKLRTPSSVPELTSLEISPELLVKQNFRIPPFVEPAFDQPTDIGSTAGMPMRHHHNQQQYRQQVSQKYKYQDSAITGRNTQQNDNSSPVTAINGSSPLRSMSVGSLNSLRQESLLYSDQQNTTIDGIIGYVPYNSNNNSNNTTPTESSHDDKSSRMYPLYYQQQQQQDHSQNRPQQQQHSPHIQQQMHSYSPTHATAMGASNAVSSVYSLPPTPNGVHYDQHPHYPHQEQQRYTTSPNPQLGHLLNPVHPLNSSTTATSLVHNDTTTTGRPEDMQVKMESMDQPIFYGNRTSPLSTAHTSRLL